MLGYVATALRRLISRKVDPMLKQGTKAPDFEVEDHAGRRVRLSDFAGKRVVLWFYPKADTPG
jgi:peroxiredoxin Q/BCP